MDVSTCPENAILLALKQEGDLHEPPTNTIGTFLKIAKERNISM
jgi:hypothetical protein